MAQNTQETQKLETSCTFRRGKMWDEHRKISWEFAQGASRPLELLPHPWCPEITAPRHPPPHQEMGGLIHEEMMPKRLWPQGWWQAQLKGMRHQTQNSGIERKITHCTVKPTPSPDLSPQNAGKEIYTPQSVDWIIFPWRSSKKKDLLTFRVVQ